MIRNVYEVRGKEEREGRSEKGYSLIGSNYFKNEKNIYP
jgi:hypothetical protein